MHTKTPIETISVHASAGAVSRYQRILAAGWTRTLPQDVLALLWLAVGDRASSGAHTPLFQILNPKQAVHYPVEYFRTMVARIAEGTRFIRRTGLPEMPADYPGAAALSEVAWQANRLAIYLTLPAHAVLIGDADFFVDVQALAFQAALHFVLPTLRKKHAAEHALLLHSAMLFALGYSAYDPAHDAYMMSQIYGYLGDHERRLRSLYAAFRFTAPQDHSYLTKAQEYWSALLDESRHVEAEEFLFSLHWRCLPQQQEEVRAMIAGAFKHMLNANHEHT